MKKVFILIPLLFACGPSEQDQCIDAGGDYRPVGSHMEWQTRSGWDVINNKPTTIQVLVEVIDFECLLPGDR